MTSIEIVSDLHLEVERRGAKEGQEFYYLDLPITAPHLALLGDIGCTWHDAFWVWLERQLYGRKTVLFVLGNHEPYRSSLEESTETLRSFAAKYSQPTSDRGAFVFLDRSSYDLTPSLTILGCTLWTKLAESELDILSWSLTDFKRIQGFNPAAYHAAHLRDLEWLNRTVLDISSSAPDKRLIVLTHHPPLTQGTSDPRFKDSLTNSAFSTNLSKEPCWTSRNVVFWACGHTHYNCDFERDGKRVYTNQRGYADGEHGYDSGKVIDMSAFV